MNNFDPTSIETAVGDALYAAGVSKNVLPNRPKSMQRDLTDFVVCHVTGSVEDLSAFGRCVVSVQLFARDVSGVKNAKKLSAMQKKVIGGMPRSVDGILIESTPVVVGDTTDNEGYHARIINYSLILKIA